MLLYPVASLLYMSSGSKEFSRLMYQALCSRQILDMVVDMLQKWVSKSDTIAGVHREDFIFLYGGVGNMIGDFYYGCQKCDHVSCFKRYVRAMNGILEGGISDCSDLIGKVSGIVENEDHLFFGVDLKQESGDVDGCL